MAKIKQLSTIEAQKIAAGEVVERPVNIVKELLENALDAGANIITLYLEDGGKKLIQVIDNGSGMAPEDAHMCIKHHATSKITSVEDLSVLNTFGFRGEALSSISSVSHMEITTKEETTQTGITLVIKEGIILNEKLTPCNTGTDIAIYDLFYNIPARKKFLKSKETEWRAINQLFYAFCLSYPAVHFRLYHEQKLVHNCPASLPFIPRIEQLYEQELTSTLLTLEAQEQKCNIFLSGIISNANYTRYDRSSIFLFVNKRWVKNHKLAQALIKGYQGMLPTGRYPAGYIFITIDSQYVDINIHPRKEEILFLHPRIIETLIEIHVKKTLEQYHTKQLGQHKLHTKNYVKNYVQDNTLLNSYPSFNPKSTNSTSILCKPLFEQVLLQENRSQENKLENKNHQPQNFSQVLEQVFKAPINSSISSSSLSEAPSKATREVMPTLPISQHFEQQLITPEFSYKLLGQTQLTYIIIETQEGLVLIDQHAAHERIIYEHLRTNFNQVTRILLLFPIIIPLSKPDIEILASYLETFELFGLIIEQLSDHEIIIRETPVILKNKALDDTIKQVISWIYEHKNLENFAVQKIVQEKLHAQVSCKASIKAGDELNFETMHQLIKELYATQNKLTCPHGRPTIWPLSTYEIEKKFKRTYK